MKLFKDLIGDNVKDLRKFFVGKDNENKKKVIYY